MVIKNKLNAIFKKYHETIGAAEMERLFTFIRDIQPHVKKKKIKVLDAGCGSGLLSFTVLLSESYSEVTMVDVDDRYKNFLPYFFGDDHISNRINYIKGDILNFDKGEKVKEKYDLVLCVDVLEHNVFYMEILRKLWNDNVEENGFLYIQTPSDYPSPNFPSFSIFKKNLKQRLNRIFPLIIGFDGSSHVFHGLSCKKLFDRTKELNGRCIFAKEEYIDNPFFPACQFKPRTSILLEKNCKKDR